VATARTGIKAERLVVTNYVNGDAKLLPSLDAGSCAPATPALPAGATAIGFGLSLFRNGTLTTDDYSMYDTIGAPSL
jgi:hypothetical protein